MKAAAKPAGLSIKIRLCGEATEILASAPKRLARGKRSAMTTEQLVARAFALGLHALELECLDGLADGYDRAEVTARSIPYEPAPTGQPPDAPGLDFELTLGADVALRLRDVLVGTILTFGEATDEPVAVTFTSVLEDVLEHGFFELGRELWGSFYSSPEQIEGAMVLSGTGYRETLWALLSRGELLAPGLRAA